MDPEKQIIEAQPAGTPPARQRSPARLVLLILGGLVLLSCLGVGVFALVATRMAPQIAQKASEAQKPRPITGDDRAVLVTIDDFAAASDIKREAEKLVANPYGAWFIQYQYSPGQGTFIFSNITKSVDPTVAAMTYKVFLTGYDLAIDNKLTVKVRDDLFQWGDDSRFAHIIRDGKPVGTRFVGRKGTLIYLFSVVGTVLDDTASVEKLLKGKLDRAESYRPAIIPP